MRGLSGGTITHLVHTLRFDSAATPRNASTYRARARLQQHFSISRFMRAARGAAALGRRARPGGACAAASGQMLHVAPAPHAPRPHAARRKPRHFEPRAAPAPTWRFPWLPSTQPGPHPSWHLTQGSAFVTSARPLPSFCGPHPRLAPAEPPHVSQIIRPSDRALRTHPARPPPRLASHLKFAASVPRFANARPQPSPVAPTHRWHLPSRRVLA